MKSLEAINRKPTLYTYPLREAIRNVESIMALSRKVVHDLDTAGYKDLAVRVYEAKQQIINARDAIVDTGQSEIAEREVNDE